MKHIVTWQPHICPKCVEKFRNELEPQLEKLARDYFKPEKEILGEKNDKKRNFN